MAERLVIHYSDRPVQLHWLDRARRYRVGRHRGCDIQLRDPRVSRRHALLYCVEDCWYIRDDGSKNGITCKGRPVKQQRLPSKGSAWLSVGGLMARFEHVSGERKAQESDTATRRRETTRRFIRQLDPKLGLKPLLQKVLESILATSGTDRGFVMLKRQDGEMVVVACRGLAVAELQEQSFSGSVGAVDLAVEQRKPVLCSDAMQEFALSSRPSIREGNIRALVCIPIALDDRLIGVVYADSKRAGTVFTDLDAELLDALAEQAALALSMARVQDEIDNLSTILPEEHTVTRLIHGKDARDDEDVRKAADFVDYTAVWSRLRDEHRKHAGNDA